MTMIQSVMRFWFSSGPPHGLAVFRILLGLYFLVYWLTRLPYVELLFSNEGMAFPYFDFPADGIADLNGLLGWLARPGPPPLAWALYGLTIASVVAFTLGVLTRTALLTHLLLFAYSFLVQGHLVDTSFDRVLFIITVILAMGTSDAIYSVAARNRRRRGMPAVDQIPIWPARLIAAQIAMMYVGAGILKILAPAWNQGEMLLYTMLADWGSDTAVALAGSLRHLGCWDLAVLLTMLGEVYAPFVLYNRRFQKPAFVVGTLFHAAIGAFLNIWPFMFMPLTYVLFIDPDEFRTYCAAITRRLSRTHTSAPEPT